MMIPRTHIFTILPFAGFVLFLGLADDSRGQQPAEEHYFSFKGKPEGEGWKLIGPDAEKVVRFEDTGLRITLGPPKHHWPTGLSTGVRVTGDFEITMSYEILQEIAEPKDPTKTATRVALIVKLDRPKTNTAGIARRITDKKGTGFTGWATLWNEEAGKPLPIGKELEASAKVGRFRFVRKGAEISHFVSEGNDTEFHLMKKFEFPAEPIKDVEIVANTGGPNGAIDVRVTDLRIRTGKAFDAQPIPVGAPSETGVGGWILAVVLVVIALGLLVGVGGAWFLLRRPAAEAPDDASLTCPGCGRHLNVKPELAGKKVKCAKCGQVVPVPESS